MDSVRSMRDQIQKATDLLDGAGPILVFSGAGISTESGIPDFRGPNGLWTKLDPDDFTIERFLADPEIRQRSWQTFIESRKLAGPIAPNRAHYAVTELWRQGLMGGCVTQNIDGLHQAAGLPPDEVVELHGHLREVRCINCRRASATEAIVTRVEQGETDPRCEVCGGILKTATVMFGEYLPENEVARARRFADAAGAVLAVGSTMSVYPAVNIALSVVDRGRPLVIVNMGPTDADEVASVRVDGMAGEVLPSLVAALTE